MIKLGDLVRDSLTGFEGIAIGRTKWLHGCTRIGITPCTLHDGKPIETDWFDEQRVQLIETRDVYVSATSFAETGGPRNDPSQEHLRG